MAFGKKEALLASALGSTAILGVSANAKANPWPEVENIAANAENTYPRLYFMGSLNSEVTVQYQDIPGTNTARKSSDSYTDGTSFWAVADLHEILRFTTGIGTARRDYFSAGALSLDNVALELRSDKTQMPYGLQVGIFEQKNSEAKWAIKPGEAISYDKAVNERALKRTFGLDAHMMFNLDNNGAQALDVNVGLYRTLAALDFLNADDKKGGLSDTNNPSSKAGVDYILGGVSGVPELKIGAAYNHRAKGANTESGETTMRAHVVFDTNTYLSNAFSMTAVGEAMRVRNLRGVEDEKATILTGGLGAQGDFILNSAVPTYVGAIVSASKDADSVLRGAFEINAGATFNLGNAELRASGAVEMNYTTNTPNELVNSGRGGDGLGFGGFLKITGVLGTTPR
jgi:hypothetical protein